MSGVLFCELSGELVATTAELNKVVSTLRLPDLYMLSKETAIAFADDEEKAISLVLKGTYRIDGLNLILSHGEDIPSRFLEVHLTDPQYELDITSVMQNLKTEVSLISPRMPTILLEFKSLSDAIDGYSELKRLLTDHQSIKSISLVPISEHRQVTCQFRKHLTLSESTYPLNIAEAVIEGLRNSDLGKAQPLIVAVNCMLPVIPPLFSENSPADAVSLHTSTKFTPQNPTQELVDLIVTCPTEHDALVLRGLQAVDLPSGHSIVIPETSKALQASDPNSDLCSGTSGLVTANAVPKDVQAQHLETSKDAEKTRSDEQLSRDREARTATVINLDLECYAIANYFKLLLKWGAEAVTSVDESTDENSTEIKEENTDLLWGEDPVLIEEKRRDLCTVTVVLENKAKLYGLIISSFSSSEASARMKRMKKLADTAVRMRQTIPMKAWCPQHREAINESEALRDLLSKTKSAVLFHESKDRVISADVVGLTDQHMKSVRIFLEALIPRQGEWIVPQDCVSDYTAANWVDVRRKFAIKLDVKGGDKRIGRGPIGSQKGTKSLKVWGFEPSMEKALRHILALSTNVEAAQLSLIGSSTGVGVSLTKTSTGRSAEAAVSRSVRIPSVSSRDQDDDDHDDVQFDNESNMKLRDSDDSARSAGNQRMPFNGHYVFLDREAGMLYQAFELEFQAYLYQAYNVTMKSSHATNSDTGTFDGNNALPPSRATSAGSEYPYNAQMQYRTPALRVEYGGNSKKDVGNVRIYMEKISSVNLSRRQIHFPRYDAMRYRELYNQKSKQETNVRMIRRHAIQQANNTGKESRRSSGDSFDFSRDKSDLKKFDSETSTFTDGYMPDPLLTVGFINIRIRPPLHSRGIRRMTFPAEITITVCSPVNTESQLADYKTLCEHFMAMDSHFITASVELPLANKFAKEIIVRTTREEFITKYGLVSLRWDENSLKRDAGNSHASILASSSFDETASRQLETSPRLRSASESNKEDVQLGVAKLWATKPEIMKIALDRLCKADGVIISVSIGDKTHRDALDSSGTNFGAISLSDILPASSASGKFRISPGRISPVKSPLLGMNARLIPLFNESCTVSNQTDKPTCRLETAYEPTLAAEVVKFAEPDRTNNYSGAPPGFSPFAPSHGDFNMFPESSRIRASGSQDLISGTSSLSSDSEPISYLLSMLNEDQGLREVHTEAGGFNVKQRVTGPPKFPYSRYPSGGEYDTPSLRSNSYSQSTTGYDYGLESTAFPQLPSKSGLLSASNDQLPKDIRAAPGLNIPTDWDHLFEKTDYRTSPPNVIPRTLSGSNSFRQVQSNSDYDQYSPRHNIKQAFSYDGYGSMPSSIQSPKSAFAPFARDRSLSMTNLLKDSTNSRDSSDLLSTESIWNENYLIDTAQSFAPIRDGSSSIFNESLASGRRMSLDLGDIGNDRSRFAGITGFDSSFRQSARQNAVGPLEQFSQSYQQIQHEQYQARQQQGIANAVENRLVVHWPHPSLRFMFLGDPLKYQLSDLLHKLRARGVGIGTPLRDKSNASACLVIEGTVQGVTAASAQVESYFRTVISQVCSVKMILTAAHREKLTSADLSRVKEIQGSAGAHIVLDPQLDEVSSAMSCFDLRLPSTDAPQKVSNVGQSSKTMTGDGEASFNPSGESIPLVSILVLSQSGLGIEVSTIINRVVSPSRYGEKSWGTSSLLMLIDSTAYAQLNLDEKRKIDGGQILVNRDPITHKIIIRVWTRNKQSAGLLAESSDQSNRNTWQSGLNSETSDDVAEYQAGALIEALSDGLAELDALNVTRMALIIPIGNKSLSALSPDLIRTITVEITVNFIKVAHLQSLQKIVCIDLTNGENDIPPGPESSLGSKDMFPRPLKAPDISSASQKSKTHTSEIPQNSTTGETILLPASGNRMALTLLLLLDQATSESKLAKEEARMRSYNPNSLIPLGRQEKECFYRNIGGERQRDDLVISEIPPQKLFLLTCNVPLPPTLSAETVCPEIILRQKQQRVKDRTAASAYSGLGFSGNVIAPLALDSLGQNRQRDLLRDQISDYRDHTESGQDNPCMIMLKGLPGGILKAVRAIKLLVTTK